jgi:hypothetical protein
MKFEQKGIFRFSLTPFRFLGGNNESSICLKQFFFSYFPVRLINAASSQRDSVGRQKVGCGFKVLSSGFKDLYLFRLNRSFHKFLNWNFLSSVFFWYILCHFDNNVKPLKFRTNFGRDLLVFLDCNFVSAEFSTGQCQRRHGHGQRDPTNSQLRQLYHDCLQSVFHLHRLGKLLAAT